MAITRRPPAWLLTTAATGGLALYIAGVLAPGQRTLGQLKREVREKQQFIASVQGDAAAVAALEQQLQRTVHHIGVWRDTAPDDPHLVEFLGKLAQLASQAGIRVNRLAPQPHERMAALRQHPIHLELEGNFAHCVGFFGDLERLPETVWIQHLQVTPHRENGQLVKCDVVLTVFADNCEISG